jgi:hypothetical protein
VNETPTLMFDDDALDAARARRLKAAGGVTALAAMAAVAVSAVIFSGPVAGSDVAAPLPATATADPAPEGGDTSATMPVTEGDEPPRTFEVFSSKNPFVPLVDTTPAPVTPAVDTTGTAPAPTPAPVTGTETPPVTLVPEPTTTTVAPARSTEPRASQRIEVLDVFTNEAGRLVANVKINDTVHQEVGEGDTFAANYKVVSLSQADRCGSFLYGDDAFKLCVGEQTLK